jgi:hypothetical protein
VAVIVDTDTLHPDEQRDDASVICGHADPSGGECGRDCDCNCDCNMD